MRNYFYRNVLNARAEIQGNLTAMNTIFSLLTIYSFVNNNAPATRVNSVINGRLGSVLEVDFTMYDHRLNSNTLSDRTDSLLHAHSNSQQRSTTLRGAPQSMRKSNMCFLEHEVSSQAKQENM